MASQTLLMSSKSQGDAVANPSNAIVVDDLEEAHGRFGGLTPLSFLCVVVRNFSLIIPFFIMENANPPPALDPPVLPTALRTKVVQELRELQAISAYIDSLLENIDQFLSNFAAQPNIINLDDVESDNGSVDIPLVSPFLDSDDDSDDGEVLNKLEEYGNAGKSCQRKVINSFDEDDLAFQCMIGFRKFVAYFDPFLPMNIITQKAYNTIMVDGLERIGMNLVAIFRYVYVFVGSFTYVTDFVVLEDIGEFILKEMEEVVMGKPFREVTKLEYDCAKGLMSFTRTFNNYTFQMPSTIPRFKNQGHVSWSKIPPILILSQRDLINGFRNAYEKNKLMYKNCLNLGPNYQVDDSMKEWLTRGHHLEDFGGNTGELSSILEEMRQGVCFTLKKKIKENKSTVGGDGSGKLATSSGSSSDRVRKTL
ncbi:hypothetical protein Tco_1108064 [Tanacetum coccineum]